MKGPSSKYQFETIDQLSGKQANYYRLDREQPSAAIPQTQYSSYPSQTRVLDYLNTAQNMQIHRAYENDNIVTRVPELQLGGNYKKSQLVRTRELSPFKHGSPLKDYTQRLTSPIRHSSPIYLGSLQHYSSPPSQPKNIEEQNMFYYRAGDAVPPPPMSYFQPQPVQSQLVSCQTFINPGQLDHQSLQHQHIGPDGNPITMDVYSELPRDQCYYCVQNTGMFNTKPAESYYNPQWIEERELLKQYQIERENKNVNQSYYKHEWEREIENKKKKNKKLDEVRENVSMESEITRKPDDYILNFMDMGITENRDINELMNSEKQKSQNKFSGMFKATIFGKKLKDAASQKRLNNQVNEVNEILDQQERDIMNYENLEFADLDHLTDEEKRKLLEYYKQMNMLNDQMKNGQINGQRSLNSIIKFVESQVSGIQETCFANGLDNLAKRIMRD